MNGASARWKVVIVGGALLCAPVTPTRASTEANANWIEVRSAHFVVSSNAGEKEARRIAVRVAFPASRKGKEKSRFLGQKTALGMTIEGTFPISN
jgi:hypothetical protein